MTTRCIATLGTLALLAGCASAPRVEGDFGNSYESLVQAQVANPAVLQGPSTAPVTGVDPDYADNVVTSFRKDVAKRGEVKQPIQILVGGDSGS